MAEKVKTTKADVQVKETNSEPTVRIFLPLREDQNGVKADQTEIVTVNGKNYQINRGMHMDVSPEVYTQLRNRFSHL